MSRAPAALAACALAASLAACASAQRPPAARAPRYVLLEPGVALEAGATPVSLRADGPVVARRVRQRGDRLVVETVGPDRQCAPALAAPAGMRLRLTVPASAVAVAVTRALHVSGPEGSLSVAAGVAARPNALGGADLALQGLRVTLADAPETGRSFEAPRPEAVPARAERLAPGTRAALPRGASVEVGADAPVQVLLRSPALQGTRVVAATPCARFEAVVPTSALLPTLEMDFEGDADVPSPRAALRQGARLSYPDGSDAGRTTRRVLLAEAGRAAGATRCFPVTITLRGVPGEAPRARVEVCAAEADVEAAP